MILISRPTNSLPLIPFAMDLQVEGNESLPKERLPIDFARVDLQVKAYDDLLSNHISSEKLLQISGKPDLNSITFLQLQVDCDLATGLSDLGKLSALAQLKLNNSNIPLIRELGTGFHTLTILWMSNCNLSDLNGIGAMSELRELYLSFNQITDLDPIALLPRLAVLDLESNLIEISQLELLANCPLRHLILDGNNIDMVNSDENVAKVMALIPTLERLNEIDIKKHSSKSREISEATLKLDDGVTENIQYGLFNSARPNSTGIINND